MCTEAKRPKTLWTCFFFFGRGVYKLRMLTISLPRHMEDYAWEDYAWVFYSTALLLLSLLLSPFANLASSIVRAVERIKAAHSLAEWLVVFVEAPPDIGPWSAESFWWCTDDPKQRVQMAGKHGQAVHCIAFYTGKGSSTKQGWARRNPGHAASNLDSPDWRLPA